MKKYIIILIIAICFGIGADILEAWLATRIIFSDLPFLLKYLILR